VEPVRTQRADCQTQIDLGMRSNAGGHAKILAVRRCHGTFCYLNRN
jgi:hypothetical protein